MTGPVATIFVPECVLAIESLLMSLHSRLGDEGACAGEGARVGTPVLKLVRDDSIFVVSVSFGDDDDDDAVQPSMHF